MGWTDSLGPAIDTIQDSVKDLANAVGLGGFFGGGGSNADNIYAAVSGVGANNQADPGDGFWSIDPQAWYKVYPYQFIVRGGQTPYYFTLPIPPQSLLIKMVPASQATATIGGVVEETNTNLFWLINLMGTTGTAVTRLDSDIQTRKQMATKFRGRLETTGLIAGVAATAQAVVSKIGNVADAVISGVESGDIGGVIGGVTGAISAAGLPNQPWAGSQVDGQSNGFSEMQELHRFLYAYSRLKNVSPGLWTLWFASHKTDQQWQVSLQDFTIQQSAQNPHLYKYNIQLKAWGIGSITASGGQNVDYDRFGPNGDLKAVNTLGLQGSITTISNTWNNLTKTGKWTTSF
jgi:hypothetical protein